MFVCVTEVDAVTKIPCFVSPMSHGPSLPDLKGLHIEFWDESNWPTARPAYFGICDDDADASIPGVLQVLSEKEFQDKRAEEASNRAVKIRTRRDGLLLACDWTQLADAPLTDEQKSHWVSYRQLLRDITGQASFPWSVAWPRQPV